MLDYNGVTLEELNLLFYVKDNELYWKERNDAIGTKGVNRFNLLYANKVAGTTSGKRKVNFTINGKSLQTTCVYNIVEYMTTGTIVKEVCKSSRLLYGTWNGMNQRAGKIENYLNVTVAAEFKDYFSFYSWAERQIGFMCIDDDGFSYELDKDVVGGSSCYSPTHCVFVPKVINALVKPNRNSKLLRGVQYFKEKITPYRAYNTIKHKPIHLGYYDTEMEAHMKHLESRRGVIEKLELQYKDRVDPRVFPALYETCLPDIR